MSGTRFRMNLRSIVAWISRSSLLETWRYLKLKWLQRDLNPQQLSSQRNTQGPVLVNGWVFVYNLSGCGFESRCSHIGNSYSKIRVRKKVPVLRDSDSVRWLWKSRYHLQDKLRVVVFFFALLTYQGIYNCRIIVLLFMLSLFNAGARKEFHNFLWILKNNDCVTL